MSKFIKDEVQQIEISGIRQFNQKANQVKNVIKLTIGELTDPTPKDIKEEAIKAITKNRTRYTENKGINPLRKEIANKYKNYQSDEVILTVGTTEGLSIVLKSIINTGDEVIIPTPGYVGYKPLIELENGIVRELNTIDSPITKETLERLYSSKTKALLVTSPNNPTGKVLSIQEQSIIKEFVLEKDILLISDEIYSDIVFEKEHYSFGLYPELKSNLVVLDGFSKSHAMTGFRIGYILSDIELINHFVKVHQYNVTSTSTISQYAALKAVNNPFNEMVTRLKENRNLVLKVLDDLNIKYINPDGAFYVFYDVSSYDLTGLEYCEKLLYSHKVAVIPGEYFLGSHKQYVRLSYAVDTDILLEALERIRQFKKAE